MNSLNIVPKPNQTEPNWEMLSDKEKAVLIAMLASKTNTEAIRAAPVSKTQFYKYKKDLEPLKNRIASLVTKKALEIMQGNAIKAAEVMADLLNSYNPNVKQTAAKEILDRTVGQPKKHEMLNQNITVIGMKGVTDAEIHRLIEPPDESCD